MDQAVHQFDAILHALITSQLRARLMEPGDLDSSYDGLVPHFCRKVKYAVCMVSLVPRHDHA
jgi:hypothetical protein